MRCWAPTLCSASLPAPATIGDVTSLGHPSNLRVAHVFTVDLRKRRIPHSPRIVLIVRPLRTDRDFSISRLFSRS